MTLLLLDNLHENILAKERKEQNYVPSFFLFYLNQHAVMESVSSNVICDDDEK